MLTADLVRVRLQGGELRPQYVDPDDEDRRELAAALIEAVDRGVGRSRGELERDLGDLLGTGTAFLFHRGLAKLLLDRCEFDTAAGADPAEARRAAFAASARHRREDLRGFDRAVVLAEAAAELGSDAAALDRSLYADLKSEQLLISWRPLGAEELLLRYNVALAQGVLLRATELEIRLGGGDPRSHRALFQRVKFHQLMHRVERDGDGWRVVLDGPLSVFQASGRYGVQMAGFLPALLHLDGWELAAEVRWGKGRGVGRTLVLRPDPRLRPWGRLPGRWLPDELRLFPDQFAALASEWELETEAELVDLGGEGVLVPDFVFRHRAGGDPVHLEVLGWWRKGALATRLKLLRRHGPPNLVLAVSKKLAAEDDLEGLPGEVYLYRTTPLAREVLARLEAIRGAGIKSRKRLRGPS